MFLIIVSGQFLLFFGLFCLQLEAIWNCTGLWSLVCKFRTGRQVGLGQTHALHSYPVSHEPLRLGQLGGGGISETHGISWWNVSRWGKSSYHPHLLIMRSGLDTQVTLAGEERAFITARQAGASQAGPK